jgi:hypothetical protein
MKNVKLSFGWRRGGVQHSAGAHDTVTFIRRLTLLFSSLEIERAGLGAPALSI